LRIRSTCLAKKTDSTDDLLQRQRALARWDNEGGAGPPALQPDTIPSQDWKPAQGTSDTELDALHSRLIALENLMTSLLATASDHQLDLAREMAAYITPRPGVTRHKLTIQAAGHMINLVQRASIFRDGKSS
jgi:hypothetical protein